MRQIFSNPVQLLKTHFVAGVFVLIPFVVIAWILGALLALVWRLQLLIPAYFLPASGEEPASTLVKIAFTVGTTILLSLGISLLGWASKHYFGQKVLEFMGDVVSRIPVIRSIYGALDQLLKTISAGGDQQFHRVVYIEYPRKGIWTLAFVTGAARMPGLAEIHLNVYVPTTPNPTSGFYLIVPEGEVKDTGMKVEEAFKVLLSLGIAQNQPPDSGTH